MPNSPAFSKDPYGRSNKMKGSKGGGGKPPTGIQWREWGAETFNLARTSDRPVMLSLSAVWCHWCHVMDDTTYSNEEIIELVNEGFVPVRVDIDKRPDISKRYHFGGFPTVAFLTPEGDVLTGGTYTPPDRFKEILSQVKKYYSDSEEEIHSQIQETRERRAQKKEEPPPPVGKEAVEEITAGFVDLFDGVYGGFGDQPKFPPTEAIDFLLARHYETGFPKYLDMVRTTLDHMAKGIYDRVEGGFFRYSVLRNWKLPHYEKMLEVNAKLIQNYLHAYQVTGEKRYMETAQGTLNYVSSTLSNREKGGFYASQDADEEYYQGDLENREKGEAPKVDRTIYVNWNGMMVSTYLHAYAALANQEHLDFALKTIRLLLATCHDRDKGMCHYHDGQPHWMGFLSDQVYPAKALLDAYEATGDPEFLTHTKTLVEYCLAELRDEKNGGFFDIAEDPTALGTLKDRSKPLADNSVLAMILLKLHSITGEKLYRDEAEKTLQAVSGQHERHGHVGAIYGSALELLLNHPVEVVIVGSTQQQDTQKLLHTSLSTYRPRKLVQLLDPSRDRERIRKRGFPLKKRATAYVCVGTTCSPPIHQGDRLISTMKRGLTTS